ncbi:hypothetical protein Tco_0818085, partial [Tanacetum coccineum]
RRSKLGEWWDCQVGNFIAGGVSRLRVKSLPTRFHSDESKFAPIDSEFKKVEEIPEVEIRLLFPGGSLPMSQLFKGPRVNIVAIIIIIKPNFDFEVQRIENEAKTVAQWRLTNQEVTRGTAVAVVRGSRSEEGIYGQSLQSLAHNRLALDPSKNMWL